jgi:hypothetical protein
MEWNYDGNRVRLLELPFDGMNIRFGEFHPATGSFWAVFRHRGRSWN